MEPCLKVF